MQRTATIVKRDDLAGIITTAALTHTIVRASTATITTGTTRDHTNPSREKMRRTELPLEILILSL